jgi:hypothetical protein
VGGSPERPAGKRGPQKDKGAAQRLFEAKRREVAKKAGAARLKAGKRSAAGRGRPG